MRFNFTKIKTVKALLTVMLAALILAGCGDNGDNNDIGNDASEADKLYTKIEEMGISIGEYHDVKAIGDGYFSVTNDEFSVGMINYKGEEILPCEYVSIGSIYDGVCAVRGQGGWGYFNPVLGKFLIECDKEEVYNFSEGFGLYLDGQRYRYILPDGSDAFGQLYYEAAPFVNGYARAIGNEGIGYINKNGELEVICEYDYFDDFSDGYARVAKGDKLGYIDTEGKAIFTMNANSIYRFSEGLAQFTLGDKMGFVNSKGEITLEPGVGSMPTKMRDEYYCFIDGTVPFMDHESGKYGFIDKSGKVIVEPLYSMVMYSCEGILRVRAEDKLYGYFKVDGTPLTDCIFTSATTFSGGTALVRTEEGYYHINNKGEAITEERFNIATNFSGEYAAVCRENLWEIVKKIA